MRFVPVKSEETQGAAPLGLWIAKNEGAKFWISVMNELKNRDRGVQDILIAVVDGLNGFPEAISPLPFPRHTLNALDS